MKKYIKSKLLKNYKRNISIFHLFFKLETDSLRIGILNGKIDQSIAEHYRSCNDKDSTLSL